MQATYVNIGSEKSCMFVPISLFLIKELQRKPLLFYAVEESLECAKIGYYGVGILTFSQLLNLFKKKTPLARHDVAHKLLVERPSKERFEEIVAAFKDASAERSKQEFEKNGEKVSFRERVLSEWNDLITSIIESSRDPNSDDQSISDEFSDHTES